MVRTKEKGKVLTALIYFGLSCVVVLGFMTIIGTSASAG
jgi:hypothetical protein